MTLDANVVAFLGYCLLLVLWVALPLVPAWATYKITPDQKLGLSGPLQALTVRASGAFGAYLAIFILLGWGIGRAENMLGNIPTAMWTVKADVVTIDSQGKPLGNQPQSFEALSVTFRPDIHRIGKGTVTLKLPGGDSNTWPLLLLQIPNFGGTEVDLSSEMHRFRKDEYNKVIELQDPIIIRQLPRARGIGAEGG